ncbi:MAG: hypothetical protein Q8R60_06615 [Mycobacteriales bacterium]|nr:hypothetical protein [Mycobacteriales bacterium]
MDVLVGPYLAAALLLVLAGAQKVLDPKPLVRALKSVGAPVPGSAVRLAAAAETALGIAALITVTTATGTTATAGTLGAAVAAGVALSYAGFTAFVLLALAKGGVLASCGCFGKADTPPTRTHAAVTGALALSAALAAGAQQALSVALVSSTAALAVTAYLVLAVLPLVRTR